MRPAIPLALLLLLAGCSAPVAGPADTATPESTPTATTPTNATAENTVAYGNLSSEAQAAFDAAQVGTATFAPDSPYIEGESFGTYTAEVFDMYEYVTRNGTYYAVSLQVDGYVASYHIRANNATVSENASVVALENVSTSVRAEVSSAIENGSHSVPPGKWSSQPPALEDAEFVRHEGETYHLTIVHGDHPTFELTVTSLEE